MDAISILAEACSDRSVLPSSAFDEDNLNIDTSDFGLQSISAVGTPSSPFKSASRGNWTAEEDELLRLAVEYYKGRNWKKISEHIPDRTDVQCLHRWQKVLRPGLVKGPWTPDVSVFKRSSRTTSITSSCVLYKWYFM
jgi:hypothetical protein